MKPCRANRTNHALTLLDVLVVIIILAIFAAMLIPVSSSGGNKAPKLACTNNLKQLGLAGHLWASEHGGLYPPDVSVTDGGTKEIFSPGSRFQNLAFLDFLTLSNKLVTQKFCIAHPTPTVSRPRIFHLVFAIETSVTLPDWTLIRILRKCSCLATTILKSALFP